MQIRTCQGESEDGSLVNWHTLVGGDVIKSERGIRGSCCTTVDAFEGLDNYQCEK